MSNETVNVGVDQFVYCHNTSIKLTLNFKHFNINYLSRVTSLHRIPICPRPNVYVYAVMNIYAIHAL